MTVDPSPFYTVFGETVTFTWYSEEWTATALTELRDEITVYPLDELGLTVKDYLTVEGDDAAVLIDDDRWQTTTVYIPSALRTFTIAGCDRLSTGEYRLRLQEDR